MNLFASNTYTLTIRNQVKLWQFPEERFVEYGPEDEWWARKYGFGREVEREQTLTFPSAVIVAIEDGKVTFHALPYGDDMRSKG